MKEAHKTIAVIFDMDGVISDTQVLHSESEAEALLHLGITYSPTDLSLHYSGIPDEKMFLDILTRHGVDAHYVEELMNTKWRILQARLTRGIPLMPGIEPLIKALHTHGCRLAVASGSPLSFIHHVLNHLTERAAFQVVVSSDEVPNGKPAPDIFLEAARRLDTLPHHCVVIEDGHSGMVAARDAGMRCIGITKHTGRMWPADVIVSSVGEISVDSIVSLI